MAISVDQNIENDKLNHLQVRINVLNDPRSYFHDDLRFKEFQKLIKNSVQNSNTENEGVFVFRQDLPDSNRTYQYNSRETAYSTDLRINSDYSCESELKKLKHNLKAPIYSESEQKELWKRFRNILKQKKAAKFWIYYLNIDKHLYIIYYSSKQEIENIYVQIKKEFPNLTSKYEIYTKYISMKPSKLF